MKFVEEQRWQEHVEGLQAIPGNITKNNGTEHPSSFSAITVYLKEKGALRKFVSNYEGQMATITMGSNMPNGNPKVRAIADATLGLGVPEKEVKTQAFIDEDFGNLGNDSHGTADAVLEVTYTDPGYDRVVPDW